MVELEFTSVDITQRLDGDYELKLTIPKRYRVALMDFLEFMKSNKKPMIVRLLQKLNKRSLDANRYAWCLIGKLADKLRTGKDEMYLHLLKEYGQRQLIKLPTAGLPTLLKAIKYYDIRKEDGNCTYIMVYAGSSEYDTREMSIFIDGIVEDCKEQGIETLTPHELERLKGEWGVERKDKTDS